MTQALTADQILGANDLAMTRIDCPEWGGHVFVRPMSGDERDTFEASLLEERAAAEAEGQEYDFMTGLRAKTCALHMCSEVGELIFTLEQVEALGKKNAAALDRVFEVARELSGITDADVKEMEGNSDAAQSGESGSV